MTQEPKQKGDGEIPMFILKLTCSRQLGRFFRTINNQHRWKTITELCFFFKITTKMLPAIRELRLNASKFGSWWRRGKKHVFWAGSVKRSAETQYACARVFLLVTFAGYITIISFDREIYLNLVFVSFLLHKAVYKNVSISIFVYCKWWCIDWRTIKLK